MSEELYVQAQELFAERRYDEARELFTALCDAEQDNSRYVGLLRDISACYAFLGEFEQSQVFARRAYQECADAVMAKYYEECYLYSEGEYESALQLCHELLQQRDHFDPGVVELSCGLNCERLNRFEKARTYFADAYASLDKDLYPGDWARLLNEYAYVLYELDRNEDALRTFEELDGYSDRLWPSSIATSLYLRSAILKKLGRYKEAVEIARRALTLQDKDDYRIQIGQLLVKLGDFESALSVVEPISLPISDSWSEFEYYEIVSIACFQMGEYSNALGYLRKLMTLEHARKVEEESIYAYKRMLAISLYQAGDKGEARTVMQELIADPIAVKEHRSEYKEYIARIE